MRHEVDEEELPDSPFYRRSFQAALAQSKDLARQLAAALSCGRLHTDENSVISQYYGRALKASDYHGPKAWKIGFVGDTGAGECSLDPIPRESAC